MRSFREYIADEWQLPKDVVMDLPKVSVSGDKEIFVENHKGIADYTDKLISVKMKDGLMCVHGNSLRIIAMNRESIVINGNFERIDYKK